MAKDLSLTVTWPKTVPLVDLITLAYTAVSNVKLRSIIQMLLCLSSPTEKKEDCI